MTTGITLCRLGTRSALSRLSLARTMESTRRQATRYFSDDKGRILSEEERAKENVYIQKWERERLEKQKQKAEKEKAQKEKESSGNRTENPQQG